VACWLVVVGDGESNDAGSLQYRLYGDDGEVDNHTLFAQMS
jgi:hypothetical protein